MSRTPVILKAPNLTDTFEIVGVAGTARNRGLDEPAGPAIFVTYSVICSPGIWMLARTESDPMVLANQVQKMLKNLDPQQAITEAHSLMYWLQFATAYSQFATFLFGVFGGIGLLLGGGGVFSVVSYGVAERTREFGIRMAMGATARDVLRLVLGGVGRIFAIGLSLGLVLSIFAAHELSGRMRGMANADSSLFVALAAVLMAATLTACVLPARAATSVQLMDALRHD